MSTGVRLKVGKVSVRTTGYPSEASFVSQINQGMKLIEKDLVSIINQFENVTPEVMLDALRPAFDKSQVYVPKRSRALMNSGYLEVTERRGRPYVEMGYAKGGLPDYAAYVHEMVEIPHQPPTQAKFAERAINEELDNIANTLAIGYKTFMGV